MAEYRGFVKRINMKEGKGKKPPYRAWKAFSCKIEKDDGTEYDEWLSLGFEEPTFKQGDYVKMTAEKDNAGYFKVDPDSVQIKKNAPARSGGSGETKSDVPSSGGSGSSRGNYSKGGVDWNSAVARSIELVNVLLTHDALPISAQKGKAAEAKRFEEILAAVDKLSVKFYNDVISLRLLETVADTVPDTKPDGTLPDSEEEPDTKETDDDDF